MNIDQDKQRQLAQKLSKNISKSLELMAQIDLEKTPNHTLEMLIDNMEAFLHTGNIFSWKAIDVLKNKKEELKMLKEKS